MRERPLFAMAVSCVLGEVLAAFSLQNSFTAVALPTLGLQLFFAAAFFLWKKRKISSLNRRKKQHKGYAAEADGKREIGERTADRERKKKAGQKIFFACFLLPGFWAGLVGYRNCGMEYLQDLSAYEGEKVLLSGTVTYAEERASGVYYYLKDVTVYPQVTSETGMSQAVTAVETGLAATGIAADPEAGLAATGIAADPEAGLAATGIAADPETGLTATGIAADPEGGMAVAGSGVDQKGVSAQKTAEEEGKIASYRKALVIDYDDAGDSVYYVGKKVTLAVTYGAMSTAANPGNYDEKSYYESRGIGLKVTLSAWKTAEEASFSVSNFLYRVRLALHSRFYELTDEKTAAFYCGMLLGEGYEISSEDKDTFRTGGIGHILAISGLHISLIGMAIYRMLKLRLREGAATAAGIAFLVFYGILTGGSPSALRAIAMFALRILAKKCGRRFDFLSAAGFSACSILLFEPNYLFYSSFQLSFCAVFGAALVAPVVESYLKTKGGLKKALVSGVVIQGVILPVQLYYFYQIAPYSMLINLIVIPSMGVVLGVGILGVLIGFVCKPVGGLFLATGGKLLDIYGWLCEKTLTLPGGLIITGAPSAARILLFYVILAGLLAFVVWSMRRAERSTDDDEKRTHAINIRAIDFRILFPWFRGKKRKREKVFEEKQLGPRLSFVASLRRHIFVALMLTAAVFVLTGKTRIKLRTTFLDVGQGNGILLESAAGTTWLVDGGSSSITSVGTYRILPCLKWAGISEIDYMVLTHVDSDHYSGLLEILAQARTGVRVGCLLVPDMADLDENYATVVQTAEENGVPVYRLMTGVTWEEEELKIECVWPDADADFTDTNEGSGVLYVTCGEFSMLLTGDIGEKTEKHLTDSGLAGETIRRITVLGVPHHGSRYSSTEDFLSALTPRLAVISVGENTYGHPSEETLARLAASGATTYTTLNSGAITLATDGEEVAIEGYKGLQPAEP